MRPHLIRLLILALCPLLVLTTGRAAQAASTNDNAWHGGKFLLTADAAFDIDCPVFSSRYTPDGVGVQWTEAECNDTAKTGLWETTPPSEGTPYKLTWKGSRSGSAGGDVWQGVDKCGATNSPVAFKVYCRSGSVCGGIPAAPACTGWPASMSDGVYFETKDPYPGSNGDSAAFCYRQTGGSSYGFLGGYPASTFPTFIGAGNFAYRLGGRPASGFTDWEADAQIGYAKCNGTAGNFVKEFVFRVFAVGSGTVPPSASPPGAGAGEPCEAVFEGQTTHSDNDTWFYPAGKIPGGSANFPASASGACQVTQVCIEMTGLGNVWRGCVVADWGLPDGAPDPAGTEQPTPETSPPPPLPVAEDEQSFWDQMLGGLFAIARALAKGFGRVVEAVGAVAGAVVDGVMGLLVPSPGFLDGKVEEVKDAWDDTPPGVLLGTVTGLPGKLSMPASMGCEGPTLDVSFPKISANGGTKESSFNLFSTCAPARENLADLIRIGLSVLVVVGGLLVSIRVLGASIGVDTGLGKSGEGS